MHAGPVGAGHYAKMVHNGIEYGLMHAYAEGYELLRGLRVVTNVPGVIKSLARGHASSGPGCSTCSTGRSTRTPSWPSCKGYAEDTGEGRWTVDEAVRLAVPLHVIAASLFARFASRQDDSPAMKAVAALRNQFGGHAVQQATDRAMYVRRLELRRLPLVRAGRGRPRAGAERAGRPERRAARPTWSRRSATWPRWTATGSPPTRRWSGPARAPAVIRCAIVHDGRELLVELEIVPGKANRARLGRSPVTPGPRRARRAAAGAVRARGPGAGPRRPGRAPALPRRPAGRPAAPVRRGARRLRPGAQAAQRPAAHGVPGPQGRRHPRAATCPPSTVWDTHLAQHGAELLAGRLELVAALGAARGQGVRRGGGRPGAAAIAYASRLGEICRPTGRRWRRRCSASLAERRPAEIERGVTLVGPHRDDLTLTLGDLPAKGYASHGESWSFALALRLAAYDLLRADGIEPVLVLDDVFAELDAGRRERLAELVGGASQVLVTCAVADDVPAALRGARYEVGRGDGDPCRMSRPTSRRDAGRRPEVDRTRRWRGAGAGPGRARRRAGPARRRPRRRPRPRAGGARRRRGRPAAARLLRARARPARPAARSARCWTGW